VSGHGEGVWGNREVPPRTILGARAEANLREGGPWAKHGFLHPTEPKAKKVAA
jgi:hypothetical protein